MTKRWVLVVQIKLLQVVGTLGNVGLGTCPFNGCQTKWTCRHLGNVHLDVQVQPHRQTLNFYFQRLNSLGAAK